MSAATEEAPDDKPKFAHLVKGADDSEPDGDEEDATDEDAAEPSKGNTGGYDLKACANDMMASFQSGDVEGLEMALDDLVQKIKGK